MQTSFLTEAKAQLAHDLATRTQAVGPIILGSQLGNLIHKALAPVHVRELGGLRMFVENELNEFVRLLGPAFNSTDLVYEIFGLTAPPPQPISAPDAFQDIAGANLWRFYSNPNVRCRLAVANLETVQVGPEEHPLPANSKELPRFPPDQYKNLAESFRNEYRHDRAIESSLNSVLLSDIFVYKNWIAELRNLKSNDQSLLRLWEAFRANSIAESLRKDLISIGVSSDRSNEIVQLAQPVAKTIHVTHSKNVATIVNTQFGISSLTGKQTKSTSSSAGPTSNQSDEMDELRLLVHRAVDFMPLDELREIRLSASTLLKMTNKQYS